LSAIQTIESGYLRKGSQKARGVLHLGLAERRVSQRGFFFSGRVGGRGMGFAVRTVNYLKTIPPS
jgi:hypothetical protein